MMACNVIKNARFGFAMVAAAISGPIDIAFDSEDVVCLDIVSGRRLSTKRVRPTRPEGVFLHG